MARQRVLKDSTDSIYFYPPRQYLGVPSSVTARIQTPSTGLEESGAAVTVDSVDTTTDAASVAGATSISVSSATGITAEVEYLLETPGARALLVRVIDVAGTTVHLGAPLPIAIASGATLKGVRMSFALSASHTSDVGAGHARVTATLGGIARIFRVPFDIVRQVLSCPLSWDDLLRSYPDAGRMLDPNDDPSELVLQAWDDLLVHELRSRGFHEDLVVDPDGLTVALKTMIYARLVSRVATDDPERVQMAKHEAEQALRGTLAGRDWWYSDDDGAESVAAPDDKRPIGVVRFTR